MLRPIASRGRNATHPDLAYAARVASLAQSVSSPSLLLCRAGGELLRLLAMPIGRYGIGLVLGLLTRVELIRLAGGDTAMLLLWCQQVSIATGGSG